MSFTDLINYLKLALVLPVIILFCPVGMVIAFLVLGIFGLSERYSEDQTKLIMQILGGTLNFLLILYTTNVLRNRQNLRWDEAILRRTRWLQFVYVLWGFNFYMATNTSTQALNSSIYLFLLTAGSLIYEGRLYYTQLQ